jgi:cytochrome c5
MRKALLSAGLLAAAVTLSGCPSDRAPPASRPNSPPTASPSTQALPLAPATTADGRLLVLDRCARCHGIQRIQAADFDRAGWTKTVAQMIEIGAQLTDAERQAVIEFLAGHRAGAPL